MCSLGGRLGLRRVSERGPVPRSGSRSRGGALPPKLAALRWCGPDERPRAGNPWMPQHPGGRSFARPYSPPPRELAPRGRTSAAWRPLPMPCQLPRHTCGGRERQGCGVRRRSCPWSLSSAPEARPRTLRRYGSRHLKPPPSSIINDATKFPFIRAHFTILVPFVACIH